MAKPKTDEDIMNEYFETTQYDDYGDWTKTPETDEDPDDAQPPRASVTKAEDANLTGANQHTGTYGDRAKQHAEAALGHSRGVTVDSKDPDSLKSAGKAHEATLKAHEASHKAHTIAQHMGAKALHEKAASKHASHQLAYGCALSSDAVNAHKQAAKNHEKAAKEMAR